MNHVMEITRILSLSSNIALIESEKNRMVLLRSTRGKWKTVHIILTGNFGGSEIPLKPVN